MMKHSESRANAREYLNSNVEFGLAVAARALVRSTGINPFEDSAVAVVPVRIGAWPEAFGAVLVVCPLDEATALGDAAHASLSGESASYYQSLSPSAQEAARAEWERITGQKDRGPE